MFALTVPLSLYIHFPWCMQKCPYCDFNSFGIGVSDIPQAEYVRALIDDLRSQVSNNPKIVSIFMGGGTPSLFDVEHIEWLLSEIQKYCQFGQDIEVTLEANPETLTLNKLQGFYAAGVNRLSIGVQSFQDKHLQMLHRIHNDSTAKQAIKWARQAGFKNINIDLMFGLPGQTIADALLDLETAMHFDPTHLSWYELTIEPETVFGKHPPNLPVENVLIDMQTEGREAMNHQGYSRYEISAYCQINSACQHNMNYWQFGDYLGVGAGAHGKITDFQKQRIIRYEKQYAIEKYLNQESPFIKKTRVVGKKDLPLEFLMNVFRLIDGVPKNLFEARTGLPLSIIEPRLNQLIDQGLMSSDHDRLKLASKGIYFLNTCLEQVML